jgi:bacteriocin biosynthesis cyclodehydratase domain-containing protein
MITRPIFKPSFHVEVLGEEGIFLLTETAQVLLRGRLYTAIAPLLDGSRGADGLVDLLEEEASPAEVYYALARLEQQGYVVEADGATPAPAAAFWSALNVDPRAAERLSAATVSLATFGAIDREDCAAQLAQLDLLVASEGSLHVAVTDDYLQEGLAELNTRALESGTPWLLCKPVGMWLWVGPLFRPGITGCWACLAERLAANREVERFLQQERGTSSPFPTSRAALPSTRLLALSMAATEAARWLGGGSTPLEGTVVTLDLASLETQKHTLTRRSQCRSCGEAGLSQPAPITLESRKKRFTADGGHRVATPEETNARYAQQISPITGVVSRLERPAGAEGVLHAYVAAHNLATSFCGIEILRRSLRSKSGGKGTTDAQAKASGLCEAIERSSGALQGDEPRVRASYHGLGVAAIHPNACMLYSGRQYSEREQWNARGSRFNYVPPPFDEEREIDWTPIWSLTRQEFRYLPTSYCYYAREGRREDAFCLADSNGNAAGNSLEEAILQGFLELVERDCVALWWYNRLRRPGVHLDSFDEPYISQLRDYYRGLGRELWALDITNDLGIPAFAAISRQVDQPSEKIMFGFGAHFDPRIALPRALTEHNQMISMVQFSSNEHTLEDPDTLDWLKTATLENQPYLVPADDLAVRRAGDDGYVPREDLRDDVEAGRKIVEDLGLEMLVLDQTRPDLGLPVAKVFVPGLRHFWARFAPGRLYDAPVKLGWLPAPLTEEQLNPIPMFL